MSDHTFPPPPGLVYFWFLNADCALPDLKRQIRAFADAGVRAVVLHPREGLLVPYAGDEWFDLIRTLCDELIAVRVQPWLYDEDYCPSGQGGGQVLADHPEFAAKAIQRFEATADLREGELFLFPSGKLLWAGVVGPDGPEGSQELTRRVGSVRRHWEASEWDSR